MKQTNNAIKFLMAQYRAIFKNAYFKGMATAVLLTAGLAAGAAQAADEWYQFDSNSSKWTEMPNNIGAGSATTAAGALDYYNGDDSIFYPDQDKVTGTVSGGDLSVGYVQAAGAGVVNPDTASTSADAFGGYIYSSGNANITSFFADSNTVTLLSGGTIGAGAYGVNIDVDNGNVTATNNIANIKGGSVTNSVYGASISTDKGSATATGNKAIVEADVADTISIGSNNWNAIRGVRAEATDTLSLTGNSVSIENL